MFYDRVPMVPLAALFLGLLDGCSQLEHPCAGFVPTMFTMSFTLTQAEYEAWKNGTPPGSGTGGTTTGSDATSGESSGAESTSGGSSGGATSDGSTTGEALSDDVICAMVCSNFLGGSWESCTLGPGDAGSVIVQCMVTDSCMAGRLHAIVGPRGAGPGRGTGGWLARAAHDEAASVHAFRALARELAALGAPAPLLAALADAEADEVRHAAVIGALARDHGASPPPVALVEAPTRAPVELAIENAIEGCVRETWAALLAAYQARNAPEPALREIFSMIAADEIRHAELAWRIDAWLRERLAPEENRRVAAARLAAARACVYDAASPAEAPDVAGMLGLPPPATRARLLAELDAALWSGA